MTELGKQQEELVRLLTDPKALLSWAAGRERDATLFADPSDVAAFAESLVHKRLHEVGKLLPLTRDVLGSEFAQTFRLFAPTFNPTTTNRHLEDSMAFCRFLIERLHRSDACRATVKFELTKLEFLGRERSFAACFPSPSAATGHWISFAVWIRIGGRVRFFMR